MRFRSTAFLLSLADANVPKYTAGFCGLNPLLRGTPFIHRTMKYLPFQTMPLRSRRSAVLRPLKRESFIAPLPWLFGGNSSIESCIDGYWFIPKAILTNYYKTLLYLSMERDAAFFGCIDLLTARLPARALYDVTAEDPSASFVAVMESITEANVGKRLEEMGVEVREMIEQRVGEILAANGEPSGISLFEHVDPFLRGTENPVHMQVKILLNAA
jgi:hypothetical protein